MNNINENNCFKKKYTLMKRRIKSLILENAALCDEVAKIQETIFIVKDERKFLLHKLLEYENTDMSPAYRQDSTLSSNGHNTKLRKRFSIDEGNSALSKN